MSINLQKSQKINLSREQPSLSKVMVGLGWAHAHSYPYQEIDCDYITILLGKRRTPTIRDVLFYNQLAHESGAVKQMGANCALDLRYDPVKGRSYVVFGDNEKIFIDFTRVPPWYDRIVIAASLYEANQRKQHFGMLEEMYIRLVDAATDKEIYIYNLSENYSGYTAIILGEVSRSDGEWKFDAIGQGTYDNSIIDIVKRYGIDLVQ